MDDFLDFAVIGVQKCATSWLYYCLREHPDISVPRDKDEAAYLGGEIFRRNGSDWYKRRFPTHRSRLIGDVSVDYIVDVQNAAYLKRCCPNIKLVLVIRDPVQRFVSSYYWNVRKGMIRPGCEENDISLVLSHDADEQNRSLSDVVNRGYYGRQLAAFLQEFDADNFLILLYEDIVVDRSTAIKSVYDFLGADSSFVPSAIDSRPKKNAYIPWLIAVENRTQNKMVARLSNVLNQILARAFPSNHKFPQADLDRLRELYLDDVTTLINMLTNFPQSNVPTSKRIHEAWELEERFTVPV